MLGFLMFLCHSSLNLIMTKWPTGKYYSSTHSPPQNISGVNPTDMGLSHTFSLSQVEKGIECI